MSDSSKVFLLIKWFNEDCWDVVSASAAGLSPIECSESDAIVGKETDIQHDGEIYKATILEIGKHIYFYFPMKIINVLVYFTL